MSSALSDSTLRTQLHTDIKAAITTVTAIYDDEDVFSLPKASANLPFVVINFEGAEDSSGGLKFVERRYRYQIVYVAARPSSGTVKAAQQTAANLIMAQLTAALTYASIGRSYDLEYSSEQLFEENEPVFTFVLTFTVLVCESR